jgi:predicted amidophosphoribosyltransferase
MPLILNCKTQLKLERFLNEFSYRKCSLCKVNSTLDSNQACLTHICDNCTKSLDKDITGAIQKAEHIYFLAFYNGKLKLLIKKIKYLNPTLVYDLYRLFETSLISFINSHYLLKKSINKNILLISFVPSHNERLKSRKIYLNHELIRLFKSSKNFNCKKLSKVDRLFNKHNFKNNLKYSDTDSNKSFSSQNFSSKFSWTKRSSRDGFNQPNHYNPNQANRLISKQTKPHIIFTDQLIIRVKNTATLYDKDLKNRNQILKNAFSINEDQALILQNYKNQGYQLDLLILDDIVTSGSTFNSIKSELDCARSLFKSTKFLALSGNL